MGGKNYKLEPWMKKRQFCINDWVNGIMFYGTNIPEIKIIRWLMTNLISNSMFE